MFPSLLYLWLAGRPGQRLRSLSLAAPAFLIPIGATVLLTLALGVNLDAMGDTHFAKLKFIFLIGPDNPGFRFSFLSSAHITAILNQVLLSALPGIMALLFVGIFYRRRIDWRDPFLRVLVIAAFFLQVFAATWNPDIGVHRDFDLFAVIGFGYTLLGAWLMIRTVRPFPVLEHAGLAMVVLSAVLAGTLIGVNHTRVTPVDMERGSLALVLGNKHYQVDELDEAERHLRMALRDPRSAGDAHVVLGDVLCRKGDYLGAISHFEAGLRMDIEEGLKTYAAEQLEKLRRLQRKRLPRHP